MAASRSARRATSPSRRPSWSISSRYRSGRTWATVAAAGVYPQGPYHPVRSCTARPMAASRARRPVATVGSPGGSPDGRGAGPVGHGAVEDLGGALPGGGGACPGRGSVRPLAVARVGGDEARLYLHTVDRGGGVGQRPYPSPRVAGAPFAADRPTRSWRAWARPRLAGRVAGQQAWIGRSAPSTAPRRGCLPGRSLGFVVEKVGPGRSDAAPPGPPPPQPWRMVTTCIAAAVAPGSTSHLSTRAPPRACESHASVAPGGVARSSGTYARSSP